MRFLIFLGILAPIVILFVAITVSSVKSHRARKPDYQNIKRLERELGFSEPMSVKRQKYLEEEREIKMLRSKIRSAVIPKTGPGTDRETIYNSAKTKRQEYQ